MWPHIEAEYQQELQGIADGVNAHGGHVDVWDITALNALEEWSYFIEQWDKNHPQQKVAQAQHRTGATGPQPGASISGSLGAAERGPAPIKAHYPGAGEHCSAFVATGAYTKDGKIVLAHNDWANYLDGERWNIIYDIAPEHGYHFVMDGLPGVIHSADDFGENADGIIITETTISDFHGYAFNKIPEFVRARKAMQYASSIQQFAQIMEGGNNGGYANNWLVGDTKTNEIADLELGLKVVTLSTSKSGFFVGSNFPVNPKLAKEETTFNLKDPANSENARHTRWLELMKQYKGKIDVADAKKFESDHYDAILHKINPDYRTLCGHGEGQPTGDIPLDMGAVEGKTTDAALAANLSFWAVQGRPCGESFVAATFLKAHPQFAWEAPSLHDMPGHTWTLIDAGPRAIKTGGK